MNDTETIAQLRAELVQARKANAELHRRAQRSEGAELKRTRLLLSMHDREELFWKHFRDAVAFHRDLWRGRYRDAVEVLRAAGVPDQVEGFPNAREGRLDEMIRRVLAQRDEARQERDECAGEVALAQDRHRTLEEGLRYVEHHLKHGGLYGPWREPAKKQVAAALEPKP